MKESSSLVDVQKNAQEDVSKQVQLSLSIVGIILVIPFMVAFFISDGTYFFKLQQVFHYLWQSPIKYAVLLFLIGACYFLVDAIRIIRKNKVVPIVEVASKKMPLEKTPVIIMKSSLKSCTDDQAIDLVKQYLLNNGFGSVNKLEAAQSFGVHLLAKSTEGQFAFMVGGLSKKLTMADIEKFAIGRAYFDCVDAICIASNNATTDAKIKAIDLRIPYLNADNFSEELQRYFDNRQLQNSFV